MRRFPAEWEPQSAVMIAWPHSEGDFNNLAEVEDSYSLIAQTISHYQSLIILCRDAAHQQHIEQLLNTTTQTHFIQANYDDIWLRDTAFLTIEEDRQARLLNFRFNGWGNKYPHTADNQLNQQLLQHPIFSGLSCQHIDFVLEGGSIESDGITTLMTTENCLLNPNRNPDYNRFAISRTLENHFGCEKILWLQQNNLAGDDTDAHIDTLARFCSPEIIAYSTSDTPDDPHYPGLQKLRQQLETFTTASGKPYQLVALPLPAPIYDDNGQRLPANYANFLIINHAVLVPVYGDRNDEIALSRIAQCFPERDIIPIPCRPIVHQYGSLHCMTMQFPATLELAL
ncbi:agmatine deiminase family protein [methane-oxidizing endosymbiont of Gigantopelta aegis]|uniref:agmatine deiminase family protein n=1 Tax=methane-oxidizing endosymbiont of Gigantopelta aegis TaxID=2794938 RepID=UPI0018DC3F60|nr:agmatine deiminase family protein [methane-oxidizing endosymbiont of Gigantopelta aegis]